MELINLFSHLYSKDFVIYFFLFFVIDKYFCGPKGGGEGGNIL